MPRVQFSRPQLGINKTVAMASPPNITSMKSWVNAAKKLIPEIPDCLYQHSPWMIAEEIITEKTILIELMERTTRDKCAVVIDRKGGAM